MERTIVHDTTKVGKEAVYKKFELFKAKYKSATKRFLSLKEKIPVCFSIFLPYPNKG